MDCFWMDGRGLSGNFLARSPEASCPNCRSMSDNPDFLSRIGISPELRQNWSNRKKTLWETYDEYAPFYWRMSDKAYVGTASSDTVHVVKESESEYQFCAENFHHYCCDVRTLVELHRQSENIYEAIDKVYGGVKKSGLDRIDQFLIFFFPFTGKSFEREVRQIEN